METHDSQPPGADSLQDQVRGDLRDDVEDVEDHQGDVVLTAEVE